MGDGPTFRRQLTINRSTGSVTARVSNLPGNLFGLSFVNGLLYAVAASTNGLYRIDTVAGTATLVRRLSFSPVGANRK